MVTRAVLVSSDYREMTAQDKKPQQPPLLQQALFLQTV
jgi:hypothetical protein